MSDTNTPTSEPDEITAGETLSWSKSLDDYPASAWELKYFFRGAGPGFDAVATADGAAHAVTVPSSATAPMTPGQYFWEAWATDRSDPNVRHLAGEGRATVRGSFLSVAAATVVDERTQAERDLAAVRSALAGNLDAMEYSIAGGSGSRSLRRFSKAELIQLEERLVRRVRAERRRERVRRGGSFTRHVDVRLNRPR